MSEANEARKRLPFNNDIEMWHKFVGFAGWLMMIAQSEEQKLYARCKHYSYDSDAYEDYCNSEDAEKKRKVTSDFKPDEECWQCSFYTMKEVA